MVTALEPEIAHAACIVARCASLDAELTIHRPPTDGPGWIPAAVMLGDDRAMTDVLDGIHARWRTPDRRVDAAFLTNAYGWYLAIAAVAPYLVGGEVLDVAPDNVVLLRDPAGGLDGVGLRSFEPVRSSGRAADAVRDGIETHLASYVEALQRVSPIGRRAAWAVAGDAIAAMFLFVGEQLGRVEPATATAVAILDAPGSPIRWRGRFIQVEAAGRPGRRQERASCCLSYRLEGEEMCDTCPLRAPRRR